jgi:hypothetical protein
VGRLRRAVISKARLCWLGVAFYLSSLVVAVERGSCWFPLQSLERGCRGELEGGGTKRGTA